MPDIVRAAVPSLDIVSIGAETNGGESSCIIVADRDLTAEEAAAIRQGYLAAVPTITSQEVL